MPSHVSAEKRVRKTVRRTAINKNRKSQIRTAVRKVEEALASGNRADAAAALKVAEPQIMRGVSKGVIHKNTGARKDQCSKEEPGWASRRVGWMFLAIPGIGHWAAGAERALPPPPSSGWQLVEC